MNSYDPGSNKQQNVLVTGAHGFLGRHVARLFAQQGHIVTGIGHGEWPPEEWKAWGMRDWHCADITLESLKRLPVTPELIIHAAGSGSVAFSLQNPLADFERTVTATAHVLEYVRTAAPACRLVYPSSASVYGVVEETPIREQSPTCPISLYGAHKLIAERLVAFSANHFGTNAAIIRFFSIYGNGLRKQLLWDACRKFSAGETQFMGTGDEIRDWLHIDDAARLTSLAAKYASPQCPIVNGGSGHGIRVHDLLQHLGGAFPAALSPTFSGSERVGDPTRYIASIAHASAWGWKPEHNWKDGVDDYVSWWMREQQ